MIPVLQIREATLIEDKRITQISKLKPERIIANTFQLPYHMSGTIIQALPVQSHLFLPTTP